MTFDFKPTETPMGVPVLTTFEVHGRVYVVDIEGLMFCLLTDGDEPEEWAWQAVLSLY